MAATFETVTITSASAGDAADLLALQKLAYRSEAALYNDDTLPPLLQTLAGIEDEFATKTVLKALVDGRLAGSVRAGERDGTCLIERLIVHPDLQGRGIGTRLMKEIEARFPGAKRFELFTGHRSERNIRLYERLGYRVFRQQRIHAALSLVHLEKSR